MKKAEKVAYWRQQVDAFQASGLTVKHYCAQTGIAVATLHYWRKRFADSESTRLLAAVPEGFLPVTLAAPVRTPVSPVEIHLLCGRSLKLAAPVDTHWLQTLVQILERPCG
ncbi:IS66 family insertion sequence element accessory protein TnpB [Acidithiobacillus thiooxidans]|uniref:IS66 family insertion sequence element accessory protein TnpA n=1 Tax=Acidithiobacillus thiooxidans TaxID=930 RepID=UPI00285A387E|nr:IS66 family insertion sequence element accessory protein TnpB [Acidithiobacillus thiooxidans]MDR7926786.1 IS66 family insertion sequence element accessory protein TnpB [Acidithiobacillus thiooxidans]